MREIQLSLLFLVDTKWEMVSMCLNSVAQGKVQVY